MAEGVGWPKALAGVRGGIVKISLILAAVYVLVFLLPRAFDAADYRHFPLIGSRVLVWCLAQAHLMFAAGPLRGTCLLAARCAPFMLRKQAHPNRAAIQTIRQGRCPFWTGVGRDGVRSPIFGRLRMGDLFIRSKAQRSEP